MNNRKKKNKRGKNPRQWVIQYIKENLEKNQPRCKVLHLTENQ